MYNTNPSSVNLQIVNILTADVSVGPIIFFFWGWLARYRKRGPFFSRAQVMDPFSGCWNSFTQARPGRAGWRMPQLQSGWLQRFC